MKDPFPVNLQTSAQVRKQGWQAESRDADGHLISCHAPIEADDPGIAEWIVECTSRGETVTFWPMAGDVAAAQTPPPSSHVDGDHTGLKPIPIEAAKRIAKEYGYDQVLIYARRCHDTPEPHGEHMTTYGRNREHCDVAARIGDTLKKFMGWEV